MPRWQDYAIFLGLSITLLVTFIWFEITIPNLYG